MGSLKLRVVRLVRDEQQQLRPSAAEPREVVVQLEDDHDTLLGNVCDEFDLPPNARLKLMYEEMKNDPEDPTRYQQINAKVLVAKAHNYIASKDVGMLMVPLQDGMLELFFVELPPAPAAVGTSFGSLRSAQLPPVPTPGSAAASGGGICGSSGGAGTHVRMSSSTSTSTAAGSSTNYSHISRLKSKERRKQAGVSIAPDVAPSPVGRGRGKSREQEYAKYMFGLMLENMLRGSTGLYYLRTDQVPSNPGFHRVKNLAFEYVEKKVLMNFNVAPRLLHEVLNTRLVRVNKQLQNIQGLTQAQVEAIKKQRTDARKRKRQFSQRLQDADDEQQGNGEGGEEGVDGEAADEEQQQQQGSLSGELPSKVEEAAYRAWLKGEGEQGKLYRLAIKGQYPKEWDEVLDDAVLTMEEQNAALKHSVAQAAVQDATKPAGSAAGGGAGSDPARQQVISTVAVALKQRLAAATAAAASDRSNAPAAGRGNARGAQDASCSGRGGGGGRGGRGTKTAALDSDMDDDESFGDDDSSSGADEGIMEEAADALTSLRAAGKAAATGGPGKTTRQQQQAKAGGRRPRQKRVAPPPTLPEQPGAQRISSREARPNKKYTE